MKKKANPLQASCRGLLFAGHFLGLLFLGVDRDVDVDLGGAMVLPLPTMTLPLMSPVWIVGNGADSAPSNPSNQPARQSNN
jgi:hypothetical protein